MFVLHQISNFDMTTDLYYVLTNDFLLNKKHKKFSLKDHNIIEMISSHILDNFTCRMLQ